MEHCEHEGPHYRSVPKGQIGKWLCADCIIDFAKNAPEPPREVVELAEYLQLANLQLAMEPTDD